MAERAYALRCAAWVIAVGLCPRALAQDAAVPVAPADPTEHAEQVEQAIPGDPWGDAGGGVGGGGIGFRLLLQTRYTETFARPSTNMRPGYALREDVLAHDGDGWQLKRFFLRIGADPAEELGFRAIIDFAQLAHGDGSDAIKQAYASLRPLPKHFELYAGVFKIPFSTMELDAIARYELANLGPTDDLIKDLGFAGRDLGAEVMVAPFSKAKLLRIYAGAFGGHSYDEHASPLGAVGGRIESKPLKGLRLGADAVVQPWSLTYLRPFDTSGKDVLPNPTDPLYPRARHWASGAAYSADITFDRWHLMVRAEGMLGTRVDVDTRYGARNFWAAWGVLAYRIKLKLFQLRPALRAEWLDADREHPVGLRRTLGAALTCAFTDQIALLVDATRTDVQSGSPVLNQPKPLPGFPFFELDETRVVAQLQVEI